MRIGSNPAANQIIDNSTTHRIIIPVYVPNLEGYFEKGLETTKLCIESVVKTRHQKSFFTVVNNGCCEAVTTYLQGLYAKGQIDQLIHFKENKGKIDAVIPVARTCSEPLVTISDGDVLFKNGWMQAVESVYKNFPEAGMVSPVPHGTVYANYTVNTLFDGFFKGLLRFEQACDAGDMLKFAESIGKKDSMYKKAIRLKYQLVVKRKNEMAVVGCGHFVSTLRKEVFFKAPDNASNLAYATQADRQYIDIPNEKSGFWRLATTGNYAYHMGNTPQKWMTEAFENLQENEMTDAVKPTSPATSIVPFFIKSALIKLLLRGPLKRAWFRIIGLKEGIAAY